MENIRFSVETKQIITTKEVSLDLPACLKNDHSSSCDEHYFIYVDADCQATLVSYDTTMNNYKIEIIDYFDLHHDLTDFLIQDFPKTCTFESFQHHFELATKAINERVNKFSAIIEKSE
jgi:hypothetical protein